MDNENVKKRKAVRAIIFDDEYKIAILEVRGGVYHKIPGGGIEVGENDIEALKREIFEEAGCDIEIIEKIGELQFVDPDGSGLIHHSVCFLTKKIKDYGRQYFTEIEIKNKFKLLWIDIDEAINLFENVKTKKLFELEMNKRDLKFVKIAKSKFK
jgi:8-oxo-dGTP pyrophosphatase MutT (NUDIX family)